MAYQSTSLQPVEHVLKPADRHWVGDGFHVAQIFSPSRLSAETFSPFVMMDHAEPTRFEAGRHRRGVGEHPHRGFETVTFAYSGEVEHRDSAGGGGIIGPGDVQWMTAASGVVHEEMHSEAFAASGGVFEMAQLWVNLPAQHKMDPPKYQAIADASIPRFALGHAQARLIAGDLLGHRGPAQTHTPITVFDMEFFQAGQASFSLAPGTTTLVFVLRGHATLQQNTKLDTQDMAVMNRNQPGGIEVSGEAKTRLLVLNGQPLGEPVVAHGPFVMNTRVEISQAVVDYQNGKMGRLG